MSEMSDIYQALMDGKRAAESLASWVQRVEARDTVRGMERSIRQGIQAYERLSTQLRDGRKHVEMPDDFQPTGCMCSWPNASPPCSWCTDPANYEEEASQ